jgi:hypothetical protein
LGYLGLHSIILVFPSFEGLFQVYNDVSDHVQFLIQRVFFLVLPFPEFVKEQIRLITLNYKECGVFILIGIPLWHLQLIKEFHSDFIPHFHYKLHNFQPKTL